MFPFHDNARQFLGATIFVSLIGILSVPTMASTPLIKSVPTEAVGDVRAIDDAARPAPTAPIHVSFALSNIDKASLQEYADGVNDKNSPFYHKWLKPAQIGQKFGAPQSDISAVVQYLKSQGFTGINVWSNNMFVSAQSGRSNTEKTFGIQIHGYDRDEVHVEKGYSRTFYAPDRQPSIPLNLASKVSAIFGLTTEAEHIPLLVRHPQTNPLISTTGSLQPADLSQIYGEATLHTQGYNGAGETIAIYSPTTYLASDITAFEVANNITGATVNIVNVNGGATSSEASDEACLDIETIIGQAPASTVNVYEGPNDGSFDIFNKIETDDPNIASESYGLGEDLVDSAYADSYETIREAMSAEGISIFVSSGDTGAYGDPYFPTVVTVAVDTSSQYVTSVGGTELEPFINTNQWNGEIAWTYNDDSEVPDIGSGGGLSIFYQRPSWQNGLGVNNEYSDGMRQVPDVSAVAWTPFYQIYTGGAAVDVGGTSGSCPLWAGSFALIEEKVGLRLGCINSELYSVATSTPSVYHDITSGNDGVYPATAGWDFVTGWGSANFYSLSNAILPTNITFQPGLQMISFPYAYASADSISVLLNGLVTANGTPTNQVAAWIPLYQNYAVTPTPPADVLVPGQGYWARFNSTTGGSLTTVGTLVSTPYYGVTLQPGWNMVGDPFTTPVRISDLQVEDGSGTHTFTQAVNLGDISPNFYGYTSGIGYIQNSVGATLSPYAGYWIYAARNIQLTFNQEQ